MFNTCCLQTAKDVRYICGSLRQRFSLHAAALFKPCVSDLVIIGPARYIFISYEARRGGEVQLEVWGLSKRYEETSPRGGRAESVYDTQGQGYSLSIYHLYSLY